MRRLLAVLLVLALPSPAFAATRYAAPDGSGGLCSQPEPCSITTAFTSLGPSNEIALAPGDYGSASSPLPPLTASAQVYIHASPAARARLFVSGTGLSLVAADSRAEDLDVESTASGGDSLAFYLGDNGRAERIVAHTDAHVTDAMHPAFACESGNATWVSSVCWATDSNAMATINNGTVTLRNLTISSVGGWFALALNGSGTVSAVNAVVLNGIHVNATTQFNYRSCDITGSFDAVGPTVTDQGGNITTQPLLVDKDHGDFRQLPLSGTVDGGTADAALPLSDFEGDSRLIGSAPDIGADERALAPAAMATGAEAASTDSATLHGTVNPGGARTTYHFDYGPTPDYGSSTAQASLDPGTSDAPVAAQIAGLTPGATYHARLVAANPQGTATSSDLTFTMPTPPMPSPTAPVLLDPVRPAVTILSPATIPVVRGTTTVTVANNTDQVLNAAGQLTASPTAARALALSKVVKRTLQPRTRAKLKFKLNAKAKKLLRRKKTLRARVVVKLSNADGVRAQVTRKVKLKSRRR